MVPSKILMSRLLKTPLLWFVLAGFTLFAIDSYRENNNSNLSILVTQGDIQRIRDQWLSQSGKPVTADMLNALMQELIQERRLYREALALGLDKNDVIVRRRLAQKLRFLTEDLPGNYQTDEGGLEAYFDAHQQDYKTPAEISFKHIYFNADNPDPAAVDQVRARIQEALSKLRTPNKPPAETNSWHAMGNIFMLGRNFSNRTIRQIQQQFGSDFAATLSSLEVNTWIGPISSPFGLHLLYIDQYLAPTLPPFAKVQAQVELDYRAMLRKENFSQYLESLATKYPVIIEVASKDSALTISEGTSTDL